MRILVLTPNIEDAEGRGINVITRNLVDGLVASGHEVGLMVGMPYPKHFTRRKHLGEQTDHLYLQRYLWEGKASFRYIMRGGFSHVNFARSILSGNIYKTRKIDIKKEYLSDTPSLLHDISFCIQAPFFYQLLNHLMRSKVHKILYKVTSQYHIDAVVCTMPCAIRKEDLSNNTRLIQFVHDFMPIEIPEASPSASFSQRFSRQVHAACLESDVVIVNSQDTKHKVLGVNPEAKVSVLYGAVSVPPDIDASTILETHKLTPDHYLVFASVLEKRKNLENILEAYALCFDEIGSMPFVIIGAPGYGYDALMSKYQSLPLRVRQKIIFTGFIPERDKFALFKHARACVFVTLYEGLGIPVIEALACSTPVLTTDVPALHEAGGKAALYIKDPRDTKEIARGITQIVTDDKLRRALLQHAPGVIESFTQSAFKKRVTDTIKEIAS